MAAIAHGSKPDKPGIADVPVSAAKDYAPADAAQGRRDRLKKAMSKRSAGRSELVGTRAHGDDERDIY